MESCMGRDFCGGCFVGQKQQACKNFARKTVSVLWLSAEAIIRIHFFPLVSFQQWSKLCSLHFVMTCFWYHVYVQSWVRRCVAELVFPLKLHWVWLISTSTCSICVELNVTVWWVWGIRTCATYMLSNGSDGSARMPSLTDSVMPLGVGWSSSVKCAVRKYHTLWTVLCVSTTHCELCWASVPHCELCCASVPHTVNCAVCQCHKLWTCLM